MSIIQRFSRNTEGRDFVVGDIHGMFALLRYELANVSFNEITDRLFAVGDLVDRGPDSEESIDYIAMPWFHSVRGNHEQMAIGVAAGKHDLGNYIRNGGQWFVHMDASGQQLYAKAFDMLPYMIEVETSNGRVGIVHAEILGDSWDAFVSDMEQAASNRTFNDLAEPALWERGRIRANDTNEIKDLHALYVGHTPVNPGVILGNVHYIDTGAVFGKGLTIKEIT
jgi:serine/threonine protein phosphatase 1